MNASDGRETPGIFRAELGLWIGVLTTVLFTVFGSTWLAELTDPLWYGFLFGWLFAVMLWLAFGVVRHADGLAVLLGEPYGTLILTIPVISIEVIMISAVMLTGENNPTLARDTLFSVLMIVLNVMTGLPLLVGAPGATKSSCTISRAPRPAWVSSSRWPDWVSSCRVTLPPHRGARFHHDWPCT